jgi:hypothetical protein
LACPIGQRLLAGQKLVPPWPVFLLDRRAVPNRLSTLNQAMNRIYQGRVTKAEALNGKSADGQTQHQELAL